MADGKREVEQVAQVAVIGAGYAGLSAAVGLRRHRLDVLLFDGGSPRNAASAEVHGFLGAAGLGALEVIERGRHQAAQLGTRIERRNIVEATRADGRFELRGDGGSRWIVQRVVLATGVQDRLPEIEGIEEFYGRSIHICPHCDAFEWRDRPIAIISWTRATRDFALKVSHWSRDVTVVTDGRSPRIDDRARDELDEHGIAVLQADIERLEGSDGLLRAIHFRDGSRLAVDAAFFNLGHEHRTALAEQLGCRLTDEGAIEVDHNLHTTAEGVWAVGDVAGDAQFVAVAVAHGVKAAIDVYRTLADAEPHKKRP